MSLQPSKVGRSLVRGERKRAGGLGGRRAHSIGDGPGDGPGGPKDPRQGPTRAPGVWMSGKDP